MYFFMVIVVALTFGYASDGDEFIDSRDNKKYKTKRIGNHTWFLQDLTYKKDKYNWDEALSICPHGWHLPSDNEWNDLRDIAVSMYSDLEGFFENFESEWWSATEIDSIVTAWSFWPTKFFIRLAGFESYKTNTIGVRCVKD